MTRKRIARALHLYRGALAVAWKGRSVRPAPGERMKPLPRRIYDNVLWAHTRKEVNEAYYLYALHLRGSKPSQFLSHPEFMRVLDRDAAGCRAQTATLRDKLEFFALASRLGLPTPEVLYVVDGGKYRRVSDGALRTWEEVVQAHGGGSLFAKPTRGAHGRGCGTLRFEGRGALFGGRPVGPEVLRDFANDGYLLQRIVPQHPAVAQFNPSSLNTLRVVTVANGEAVEPLAGFLRIGAAGKETDNWSTGGVAVGIDLARGVLHEMGFYKYGALDQTPVHPVSGVRFSGFEIPYFREALSAITAFHRGLGCLKSVGWDVAITPEGPCVVEGNAYWGGMFFQAVDHDFMRKYLSLPDHVPA